MLKPVPGRRSSKYNPLLVSSLYRYESEAYGEWKTFFWSNLLRKLFFQTPKEAVFEEHGRDTPYIDMEVGQNRFYLTFKTDEAAEAAYNQVLVDIEDAYKQFKVPLEVFSKN